MRSSITLFSLLVLVTIIMAPSPALCEAPEITDNTNRIHNTSTPHHGRQVLNPQEIWRIGGESEDFLFGFIITAEIDTDGLVYLLDRWLGAVHVVGPDGEFVRQLSREGEGPGETNQPTDITWLPDGELGITQPMPGQLVRIDKVGNPRGDIIPAVVSAQEAEFGILTETVWRGGTFACSGSQINFRKGRQEFSNFLAVCDLNSGEEIARILQKESFDDGQSTQREVDQYWISEGRWCLGPDGKIYTAPQRDAYTIHVYFPDGRLDKIIERDYKPWSRTKDELEAIKKRKTRPENEWGGGREIQLSDDEPCITNIRVADNGELWVRHSRSDYDQEKGVFATWDVFADNGTYIRTVAMAINGDPDTDQLLFLGDDRVLLIRGFYEASNAMWGPGETGEEEIVGEIVFYDMTP